MNRAKSETPAQISEAIAADRAALAQTVSQLAAKADVKARVADNVQAAQERVATLGAAATEELQTVASQTSATVNSLARRIRRDPLPYLLAAGATVLAIVLLRRRWR